MVSFYSHKKLIRYYYPILQIRKLSSNGTYLSDFKASRDIVLRNRPHRVYETRVASQYVAAVSFINHCVTLPLAMLNTPILKK